MKTNDFLAEQIAAPNNLLLAWRNIRGNIPKYLRSRSAGPDGITIATFEENLTTELQFLSDALLQGHYQPQAPKIIQISKKSGGTRTVGILNVIDRVAQRAAQQVLEPLWEGNFLDCSFGFRPGLSIHDALHYAQQQRSSHLRWLLDGDITDCFGSIDHTLLMKQVQRQVHDHRTLNLIENWLDVGILSSGTPEEDRAIASTIQSWVEQGVQWISNQNAPISTGPYIPPEYRYAQYENPFNHYNPQPYENASRLSPQMARNFASSGLMLGASWAKKQFSKVGKQTIELIKSPVGKQILKKGVIASSALAAIALTSATTAMLIQNNRLPKPTGVLQGSPISPLLANIYLHLFDLMMTKRGHTLVRYADDWVVLSDSRHDAERAYRDAEHSLNRLKLEINPSKTAIHLPNEKVKWLGGMIE